MSISAFLSSVIEIVEISVHLKSKNAFILYVYLFILFYSCTVLILIIWF